MWVEIVKAHANACFFGGSYEIEASVCWQRDDSTVCRSANCQNQRGRSAVGEDELLLSDECTEKLSYRLRIT
jgi:hypothetical protein